MSANLETIDQRMARILIAEDQADLREMLSLALSLDGHQVVATTDGEETLNQALATSPDLIVLDIKLPKLNGYLVYEELKKNQEFGKVPFIFISALTAEEQIRAGFHAQSHEFLPKPFSPQTLCERVNALLGAE